MRREKRRPKRNRVGRPETRVLKINLPVEEAMRRMFADGLPRKKRKGVTSKNGEAGKVKNRDQVRTAGTRCHVPRRTRL